MRKLRKMLGDITDPSVVSLMRLIETQSKATLSGWAVDYAEKHYLGIYQKVYADERRLQEAVSGVREYLDGSRKQKDLKPLLQAAVQAAQEAVDNPPAQAAARAVATACRTVQSPASALGFAFYGAAASAYEKAGLVESQGCMMLLLLMNWYKYWDLSGRTLYLVRKIRLRLSGTAESRYSF